MTAHRKARLRPSSRRFSPGAHRLPPSAASAAVLAAAGVLMCHGALAAGRIPANALPTGPSGQALANGSGSLRQPQIVSGSFNPYTVSGNTATITQNGVAGILRWERFDIGADAKVIINQPSASAVLLNKVDSGAYLDKTVIEGMLKGNGQVYIYNPNGIIFGRTSQVDVNSLVATTLKIDDARFLAGLLAPSTAPIFKAADGVTPGEVAVEGDAGSQAQLTAARGGKILLVGSTVTNAGRLSAPDGQVMLAAASDKVYLAAPTDVTMRGLLVEVGTGGTAINEKLGKILVEEGNATLVAMAVNQSGLVSATTSVQANGSIYLHARGNAAEKNTVSDPLVAQQGGTLTLGEGSITQVLPDTADTTTAVKSAYHASVVDLAGQSVHFEADAKVVAPGGDVTVTAQADPKDRSTAGIKSGTTVGSSGVYMEAGSGIDVSGTTDTELAMESNVITVELRGTELADVPLLRNSVLRGQTVKIDRRKGTSLANIQGWIDLVEYGIGENTAAGGTVTFNADQEVVLAEGSRVNVSGGKVNYRAGHVATTQLESARGSIDIGSATADRVYSGLYDAEPGARNYEAAYSDGYSAGSVRFNSASLVLRGELLGSATPGAKQRDVSASNYPQGGQLIIGSGSRLDTDDLANNSKISFLGRIAFGGTSTANAAAPLFGTLWSASDADMMALRGTADIDATQLASNGFTRINAYTHSDLANSGGLGNIAGTVTVDGGVSLGAGGEFRVAAEETVDLIADIRIAGGTVEAKAATSRLSVADGVSIDVAGVWTNDRSSSAPRDAQGNLSAAVVTGGGSIVLSGMGNTSLNGGIGLAVGDGVRFDASGGAWQNAKGKMSGGSGGTIALTASPSDTKQPQSAGLTLGEDVDFRAYGLAKGGTLKLGGRNVELGGAGTGEAGDLNLDADFFTHGGFAKYDITAAGNLTVAGTIAPRMDNWVAGRSTLSAEGGSMADAFDTETLPLAGVRGSRNATSISLTAASKVVDGAGRLWLKEGAAIETDPGATVTLTAGRQLTVDGRITDHGGTVNLSLSAQTTDSEIAYRSERSIWLGKTAVIDVSGTAARLWTDDQGYTQGELLDGGSIRVGRLSGTSLAAALGYVAIEDGARLDVSGATADMTLLPGKRTALQTREVASAGGSIDIRSREGMLIEGEFSAAGGNASASGGSLSLTLDREGLTLPEAPTTDRELVVLSRKFVTGSGDQYIVPKALDADEAFGSETEGKGYVLADTLNDGGFDRIALKSENTVGFDAAAGAVTVSARAGITVDAPVIAARNATQTDKTVTLAARHVALGNSDWRYQNNGATASAGDGATLDVKATTIDIVGNSVLQGFTTANFRAGEDIRYVGVVAKDLTVTPPTTLPAIHALGSLAMVGNMNFIAAQVYPTTLSEFALSASGSGSTIAFYRNGVDADAPLSAAGTLSIEADHIVQDGVVRAPFGSLTLTAADTLSFGAGSLTSVAGEGSVPLGRVENSRAWVYDFGNGHTVTLNDTSASNSVTLPDKEIIASAPTIEVDASATLDLSGGGDLYAYEFTAGPGGSRDVLAKVAGSTTATTFAILPGYDSSAAPLDYQYQQDGGLKVGDRIYLSGIPGLAAGYYTLLPAHYALLKGGFAVTAVSGTRDLSASGTYQKIDGQWVVAGYRASSVAQDGRWSGFLVTSNAQVRDRSAFTDYSANTMLAGTTTRAPRDGGHVAFAATDALTLDGLVKLGAAAGRGGLADISAPEITIVADKSQSGSGVKLSVAQLMALGADSLLLGGVREIQSDGTYVAVGADTVTLANDAAHPLTGPEIILAAKDEVRLTGSSRIVSEGTPAASGGDLIIRGSGADADGALLRVSGGEQVAVVRDAPAGDRGTLTIESGARVGAAGSVNLDATHAFDNQGTLALEDGAALGLGANRISFGDEVPASVDGLRFDTAALAALNELADLSLTSYTTFDVHGSAELGSASTGTLALRGAGIQSYGDAGDTLTLKADTVRFDGGGTYTLATPAPGAAATLAVTATDVEIGSKAFALKGFAQATVTAQREVRSVGTAGSLTAEKAMTVKAGLFTARSGTSATIAAGGKLTLSRVDNAQAPVTIGALGGKLRFEGDSIESAADITARSGQVALAAANGVKVTGGVIDVSGYARTFGSTTAYAGAGSIELDGGNGKVEVGTDATLDLSAVGADAGVLTVKATNGSDGQVTLAGTLKAGATAGIDGEAQTQGRFVFDADQVTGFGALNDKLNNAGFTEARSFRIRHDDVTLAEGESIVAHDVLIAADNGNVTVAGSIDADGAKGGSIQIYASQSDNAGGKGNVTLTGTASLSARATQAADSEAGSAGDGGRVIIGTATADGSMVAATAGNSSIDLQEGAVIDVSGLGAGQGGTVTLRAPRVGSDAGSDVAVAGMKATITGSRETVIEGFKTYTASQITEAADDGDNLSAGTGGAMYTDAATFAGHSADILDRLASDNPSLKLRAGVEVRSLGDLLVSVNELATNPQDRGWNLNAWRFDGEPGVLTLRAAGDLVVAGSISDGFVKSGYKTPMPGWDLDTTGSDSWSYRLAGGADLDAADPLAVKANNAAGDVKVMFARTDSVLKDQPVAMIRTGTGSIDIAAARDVVLDSVTVDIANPYASVDGNSTVETTLGATLYTAGRYTALEEGFLAPKRQTINTAYSKETAAAKTVASPGFAKEGGSISIVAGRDVIGTATNQSVNTWLFRRGKVTTDADGNLVYGAANSTDGNSAATRYEDVLSTGWWIRYDYFSQGIATLGGGDLTVSAGGNIENLSLSVATSGQLPGTAPGQSSLVERGGGDLTVRAGGDIRGGSFYVQKGNASLTAGGSVMAGDNIVADEELGQVALRPVLALGDGRIDVTATGNVEIETVYNPTLTRQSTHNADIEPSLKRTSPLSAFATYDTETGDGDPLSGVTLTSLAGDVVIGGHVAALSKAAQPWTNALDNTFIVYPPSFRAAALTGDIRFLNGFSLWPAATSQLDLLAAGSIRAEYPRRSDGGNLAGAQPIAMIDASPAALPNIFAPVSGYEAMNDIANILNPVSDKDGLAYHTSGGLHAGDDQPVRLIALTGDIVGETYYGSSTSGARDTLIVPKAAEIIAGRDIVDFGFKIQHLDEDDVTTISAGRDFIDTTYPDLSVVRHVVTGPGRLDISAGRDIDLGTSSGIVTRGNLDNPYLPEEGAAINLLAGARADYVAFADAYLNTDNLPPADRSALVAYLRELDPSLPADMNTTAALALFKALPAAQQEPFLTARKPLLNDIFFEQIRIATGSKGGGALDLAAFDAVIESLFPAAGITGGDINVFGSQLKTTSGGSINLFAPGGSVQAGLAEKPAWVKARGSSFDSELGVYTIAGGNLQALVKKDFLVNQGRVFTLGGGDITLVSQYGDIDAGKGAKTAQSTPPPVMRTDEKGNTIIDISASISGSGIATLRTGPEVPASSVYPIAPRGIFDAGDAGVRSTGTVSIVAQTVLNANNIAAAGGISGAQAVDSSGLGGAVAAPTVASTATDAFAAPAAGDANAGSLTVELVGYGGADGQEPVTKAGQTSALADEDADDQRKRKKLQKPAADSK